MTALRLTPTGLLAFGRRLPCTIGRGGVSGDKREGDGATPRGTHRIAGLLYRPDRMAPPAPWARPIRPRDIWSDDPADPGYNRPGRAPSSHTHERLWRADRLYDLVLLTDWNGPEPAPGRGSAIFLHRWRRRGTATEGCIALSARDLRWLAVRAAPGSRLVVP